MVLAQLGQPTIAPGLGTLQLPEDHTGWLAYQAIDLLNDVGAQFSFGNGLDGIHREPAAQQLLELELENLSLRLLRALVGFALQLLDRPRHGFNGLVLLKDLQPRGLIRFLPGLYG